MKYYHSDCTNRASKWHRCTVCYYVSHNKKILHHSTCEVCDVYIWSVGKLSSIEKNIQLRTDNRSKSVFSLYWYCAQYSYWCLHVFLSAFKRMLLTLLKWFDFWETLSLGKWIQQKSSLNVIMSLETQAHVIQKLVYLFATLNGRPYS